MKKVLSILAIAGMLSAPSMMADTTIYYDNSASQWDQVNIHYWSSPSTTWPGVALIEQFTYPKHGPGEYWEATAHEITEAGGELLLDHPVKYVNIGRNGKVESIT
ncbi:MAG: hypothetical protein K2M41_05535, partial [Muribaculaceae bacterium]|nr:hypothetical protein [Muribaculaceae bacterium]